MTSIKKQTIRAFSWDILGRFLTQGSTFVVSIILARLLAPEEFGLVAMALAFVSVFSVFLDVGFSTALIQNQKNTQKTYSSIFYFNVFAGVILTAIFYLIAPWIGEFYHNPSIVTIVRWLSLSFIFNSFNRVQNAILSKELNFKYITLRTFSASVLSGTLGIIAAYQDWGVFSIVLQYLSFGFFSSVFLWSTGIWKPSLYFSFEELKKLLGFSSYAFFERIVNSVFVRLDVFLLAKFFPPLTIGFYSRASTLKEQVTKYSSSSIIRVLFPVLSKLQNDHAAYQRIYFKMFSLISLVCFLLSGILYFLGSDIILLLFGRKWQQSIPIFQILILASCAIPLNSLMWNAMMSKGKSKENFYFGTIRKLVSLIPFYFAFQYGIWLFTVIWVIITYINTFFNMIMLKNQVDIPIFKHLKLFSICFIPLVPSLFLFEFLDLQVFATRFSFSIGFVIFYFIFHFLAKTDGLLFILDLLNDFKTVFGKKILFKSNAISPND